MTEDDAERNTVSETVSTAKSRSRLSALAQLIALHGVHGMTKVADLVAETGYTERAIYKARAELRCMYPSAVLNSSSCTPVHPCTTVHEPQFNSLNPGSQPGGESASRVPASITTHATKESSSKILNKLSKKDLSFGDLKIEEIEGFNGETAYFVEKLATGLSLENQFGGAIDIEGARARIASDAKAYGVEAMKSVMRDLIHTSQTDPTMNWHRKYETFKKVAGGSIEVARPSEAPAGVQAAFEVYCAFAKANDLAAPAELTGPRIAAIGKHVKRFGPQGWQRALNGVADNDFFMGVESSFKLTLDFFLKDERFLQFYEAGTDAPAVSVSRIKEDMNEEELNAFLAEELKRHNEGKAKMNGEEKQN